MPNHTQGPGGNKRLCVETIPKAVMEVFQRQSQNWAICAVGRLQLHNVFCKKRRYLLPFPCSVHKRKLEKTSESGFPYKNNSSHEFAEETMEIWKTRSLAGHLRSSTKFRGGKTRLADISESHKSRQVLKYS